MPPQPPLKFALDQNFPKLIADAEPLLPDLQIVPIRKIDARMSELDDRNLVIALYQMGWDGLITNNYKMLYQPAEIAAILKTRLVVFAVKGVGDDPVRATGSVLLDLSAAVRRATTNRRVFLVGRGIRCLMRHGGSFARPPNVESATRRIYNEVEVTREELESPVLSERAG